MDPSTSGGIDTRISEAVKSSQHAILDSLDRLLSTRLNEFEQKMSDKQAEISETQLVKLQNVNNESYKFKRPGNEAQFKHNSKVLEKMREACVCLENPASDSKEKAANKLTEGMDIVLQRQKLVKLADSSEYGWKTVQEYETHQLADDSDDERRIIKAETRAQKKTKQERLRRSARGKRFHPYSTSLQSDGTSRQLQSTSSTSAASTRKPGLCFACGKPGHWRQDCLLASKSQNDTFQKISSLSDRLFKYNINKIPTEGRGGKLDNRVETSSSIFNTSENSARSSSSQAHSLFKIIQANNASVTDKSTVNHSNGTQSLSSVTVPSDTVSKPVNVSESSPVGSLKQSINRWLEVGANSNIINVIEQGYKLPFKEIPSSVVLKNNKSAMDNGPFVKAEIASLLSKGCISEVLIIPKVVNPLTVAFGKNGKARLVLDCRHLNLQLFKFKFKLEDASVARLLFEKSDFLFKFDLKSAYHHISIFEEHRQFLGFHWKVEGKTKYFVFNVLPFGISTAAYLFTKVTRVLVKFWRERGMRVVMYLDDGLGGASTHNQAMQVSKQVCIDLEKFGFLIAHEKCCWEPVSKITWLGHIWETINTKISISDDRIESLEQSLVHFLHKISSNCYLFKVRVVAAVVGKIISMQGVLGPAARLRTRGLYECILNRASWEAPVLLNKEAVDKINFWKENCRKLNSSDFLRADFFSEVIYSDASHDGYGGYVDGLEGSEVLGTWSEIESGQSSTWRELEALNRVCKSLACRLEGRSIQCCVDNKNVVSIVKNGSRKKGLQQIALDINDTCEENHMSMVSKWVPRELNERADFLSKCKDSDDWEILEHVFCRLNLKWGPHDCDRFATNYNAKCENFNSLWWCPGTSGVNSFAQDWSSTNNWFVPPPRCILESFQKLKIEKGKGTFIVPFWRSASFWPLFIGNEKCETYVKEFVILERDYIIKPGRGQNGIFMKCPLPFDMVAFRVEF